jgi:hypothetical protein
LPESAAGTLGLSGRYLSYGNDADIREPSDGNQGKKACARQGQGNSFKGN